MAKLIMPGAQYKKLSFEAICGKKHHENLIQCRCDCGRIHQMKQSHWGRTQSCGKCDIWKYDIKRIEKNINRKLRDLRIEARTKEITCDNCKKSKRTIYQSKKYPFENITIKVCKKCKITSEHKQYIEEKYPKESIENIAKNLNISYTEVRQYVKNNQLYSPFGTTLKQFAKELEKFKNKSGIYAIRNNKNKKCYIGSSNDMYVRLKAHLTKLQNNKHKNKELQQDWNANIKFKLIILFHGKNMTLLTQIEDNLIHFCFSIYNKNYRYDYYQFLSLKDKARFYKKINKTGECHLWTGQVDKDGYGNFNWRVNNKKIGAAAHRVAYYLYYRRIIPALQICHKCDNTACVNPKHLYMGTDLDNSRDREKKNRGRKSKIPIKRVLELKRAGLSLKEISKQINYSGSAISWCLKNYTN